MYNFFDNSLNKIYYMAEKWWQKIPQRYSMTKSFAWFLTLSDFCSLAHSRANVHFRFSCQNKKDIFSFILVCLFKRLQFFHFLLILHCFSLFILWNLDCNERRMPCHKIHFGISYSQQKKNSLVFLNLWKTKIIWP